MRTQKHGKMKIIVNENEKGLLFKNGRFIRILDAGKYICLGGKKIEKLPLNAPVVSSTAALETLMTNDSFRENVTVFDVPEGFIALEFIDGYFVRCHRSGRYAFWNNFCEREMRLEDLSTPKEADYISKYEIPTCLYTKFEVESHELGCLYFDGVFKYILEPGVYYYWNGPVHIECRKTDMRLTRMDISGQEILTLDKVTVRVNFALNYRITDCVKVVSEVGCLEDQLHLDAQLALRDYIGSVKLDEMLENKNKISEYVLSRLKEKERELYVEITEAGVRDIILPGEIRDIMNTVLAAEKRAQAALITRREEVASTRSLLNTARLMDENETLYKLKELEYIERIFGNVSSLSLSGGEDILSKLSQLVSACRGKNRTEEREIN